MADFKKNRGFSGGSRNDSRGRSKQARVSKARTVAFETLLKVDVEDAYANIVLPKAITEANLDSRDASFATELVYGTLRNLARVDWVIEQCMPKKIADLDPEVRAILRLTAHQILHLRVPDHAAVAESVELTKHVAGFGVEKFVNGVARAMVEHTPGEWERRIKTIDANVTRVSVLYSHPEWIVRAFAQALQAHGRNPKELTALLKADNDNPKVMLCARPGQILPVELADDAERYLDAEVAPGAYSEWSVAITHGDPGKLAAVCHGAAAVQDEGSQLVASALAELDLANDNGKWLDMCAGPGGKAGLVAAYAQLAGATLLANEVSAHRAHLVEQTVREFDNVEVIVGDGRKIAEKGKFSRIILDAPCSGLGALRRRPESRWRRQPNDLNGLIKLQAELLEAGIDALEKDGVLAYITCSPHESETVKQIQRIAGRDDIKILDSKAAVEKVSMSEIELSATPIGNGNSVQLWPHLHTTDAMFLCLIQKVK
ncbi:putative ribosomal RNA small subunit methyltransferase B [Gleimia coleocanis DSM 15436]|uniref:Putative ribosomal RNA small subunit methyltransferase B n=1 Tax=Gleimia coleocanis DSM 15436 TaxID=525245 RepID=C0W1K3_9ACTO|nr:transcription antitermination factor NusB [Gleimia coleocanis]EEH63369.1 putative ribosomal RNA small subunit methyltransferase B [Gleimia coleocanis DSM 15436]